MFLRSLCKKFLHRAPPTAPHYPMTQAGVTPSCRLHCQEELEADLAGNSLLHDETMMRWFRDGYSTSKHLLILYSIAVGLRARRIVEVGFGRSTFVLTKAAAENNGTLVSCDIRDMSRFMSSATSPYSTLLQGTSADLWARDDIQKDGIDFAFLDFFSDEAISSDFVRYQISTCLSWVKQNGIVAVHDTCVEKYRVSHVFSKSRFPCAVERVSLPFQYGLGLLRRLDPSPYGILEGHWTKKPDTI